MHTLPPRLILALGLSAPVALVGTAVPVAAHSGHVADLDGGLLHTLSHREHLLEVAGPEWWAWPALVVLVVMALLLTVRLLLAALPKARALSGQEEG